MIVKIVKFRFNYLLKKEREEGRRHRRGKNEMLTASYFCFEKKRGGRKAGEKKRGGKNVDPAFFEEILSPDAV